MSKTSVPQVPRIVRISEDKAKKEESFRDLPDYQVFALNFILKHVDVLYKEPAIDLFTAAYHEAFDRGSKHASDLLKEISKNLSPSKKNATAPLGNTIIFCADKIDDLIKCNSQLTIRFNERKSNDSSP